MPRPKAAPEGKASDSVPPEAAILLRRCLSFSEQLPEIMDLRMRLLSGRAVWKYLFAAASETRLAPALFDRLRDRGLLPPVPKSAKGTLKAPAEILEKAYRINLDVRVRQADALVSIVRDLNDLGMEPILLKGARALWNDDVPWRTMRDLDLLLPGENADRAHQALLKDGFGPLPDMDERPRRHHLAPLFKDGFPGWVEIHRRGGNPYAEQFLSTRELAADARLVERDGARALVLPQAVQIWNGLVHYHFGHSGFARGLVDAKGLFEFASALSSLDEAGQTELKRLSHRDPAGLAAFDIWVAAAADCLGLEITLPWAVTYDAMAVWRTMDRRSRSTEPAQVRYPGYGEAARLGWNGARIRRLDPPWPLGPLSARVAAIRRLMPKIRRT